MNTNKQLKDNIFPVTVLKDLETQKFPNTLKPLKQLENPFEELMLKEPLNECGPLNLESIRQAFLKAVIPEVAKTLNELAQTVVINHNSKF